MDGSTGDRRNSKLTQSEERVDRRNTAIVKTKRLSGFESKIH